MKTRGTPPSQMGVVILAAGKATRMESDTNKVLHPVAGEPMLSYVLEAARKLQPRATVVVIGHQGEEVRKRFQKWPITWVRQTQMRGTGDAVRCTIDAFRDFEGAVLILYGDIPGIRVETLRRLAMVHGSSKNAITLLTAELEDPTGYGRIVLGADGMVARIVEEKDATEEEKEICEINTGIGMYDSRFLFTSVRNLKPNNRQRELYLTDLVGMAREQNLPVGRLRIRDHFETLGVNDRESLAEVARVFFDQKATDLLKEGVTLEDPATTSIDPKTEIGKDSVVEGGVEIAGRTRIGAQARIGMGSHLDESDLGARVKLGARVSLRRVKIGPDTSIGANTVIGSRED